MAGCGHRDNLETRRDRGLMSDPPLGTFLEARDRADSRAAIDEAAFATLEAELVEILAEIVETRGVDAIVAETSIEPGALDPLIGETAPEGDSLTLETAAAVLSMTIGFSASEVRARLRDHLVIAMSRGPIDVTTVAERYGFGEPASLRAKIEGEEPFLLREYARLRVVLGWIDANHKP